MIGAALRKLGLGSEDADRLARLADRERVAEEAAAAAEARAEEERQRLERDRAKISDMRTRSNIAALLAASEPDIREAATAIETAFAAIRRLEERAKENRKVSAEANALARAIGDQEQGEVLGANAVRMELGRRIYRMGLRMHDLPWFEPHVDSPAMQ